MRLLILTGLLAISFGQETSPGVAEKTSSRDADDIVMLEIDVKEPVKRSPLTANTEYGAPSNQYIVQHADGTQELPPEYLSLVQQYEQEQPQAPPPQRIPQPAYAKQQQALQQAYYNYRKPAVVPPRPRPQLHPQALAQAEVNAELQAQLEAQNRADAIRTARLGSGSSASPAYQLPSATRPKLGTFEQELLQLVSANQAEEFKLLPTQPKGSGGSVYSQQLVSYPVQYGKPAPAAAQLSEQYHIETSPPRYHQSQPVAPAYQSIDESIQYQPAAKPFNPSPRYDYTADDARTKVFEQAQAQVQAHAQAQAEADALAFQKIAQAAYKKHRLDALEHMRVTNERHRQQSALEQIQQGEQVSNAGRYHLQEQYQPKGAEIAYRTKLKAQAAAETAEARKQQQAAEFKAHADAIRKLEAQQQAHLRIQEQVHNYALNFEKNLMRAQELAQAQAEALYKSQLQARNQVNNEILAISKGQVEGKKADQESPIYHYTLSTTTPLPLLNSYFTNDQLQKYQAAATSHAPRSVLRPDGTSPVDQQPQPRGVITQPRQSHKLKIPSSSPAVYVSESGLLKKSPVKSITVEEVGQADRPSAQAVLQAAKSRPLTEEELSALIDQGYSVTPVPQAERPVPQYAVDNASVAYYAKKQKSPVSRPEYVTYEEVIQRPRKLLRKSKSVVKQDEKESDASEKVTYLVPVEPSFGTRQSEE